MASFDTKKALNHLNSKWRNRVCPMCGSGPWNVQETTFQLMEFNEGAIAIGGPVIPVIPVICANCGTIQLVNAIVAGVVKPGANDSEPK